MGIPGKSLYDRMISSGPVLKALAPKLEAVIAAINEIRSISVVGQNPHKVNDSTNELSSTASNSVDTAIDLYQDAITKYEAHIASATHHLAADTTNVVTEVGVPIEIYTLLNELKVDYEANRVNTTSHHSASGDTTNTITAANATTKALAVLLANDLKTQLNAHMATASDFHGGADDTAAVALDDLDSDSTWEEIAAMADAIRTAYTTHIASTTNSCHAGADSTNTVTATAIGTFATAVYAGINELKADFNAHVAEFGTSHSIKDDSNVIATADASSDTTLIALANAIGSAYSDHISRSDDFDEILSLHLEE